MDRFGLIGYPTSHSRSPMLFREAYGRKYSYDLIETADFEKAWETFSLGCYRAVNVTAPFKEPAFHRAEELAAASGHPELISPVVRRTGACNILLKTGTGIAAYNSDYLAVRSILKGLDGIRTAAVIGYGGAGKAAEAAALDCGLETAVFHHDGIADGVSADIIIYTLPCAVEGIGKLNCRFCLESNYRDPCLKDVDGYIPGTVWLRKQAEEGFPLMTSEKIKNR